MRPDAPGGDLRATNCTGAGTHLVFTLTHDTGLSLRTMLYSTNLELRLSAYKKWQSKWNTDARFEEEKTLIEITAKDAILVEWANERMSVPFGNPANTDGVYKLRRQYEDGQTIKLKNFTGDWVLLTLPALQVNGTEVTLPPIRMERRTIPALVSINC